MNHRRFRRWVQLSTLGELNPQEHTMLEQHLQTCRECSMEMEKVRRLTAVIRGLKPGVEVTDQLLAEARNELRITLGELAARRTWFTRLQELSLNPGVRRAGIALAGAAMILGGILIGRFTLSSGREPAGAGTPGVTTASLRPEETEPRITNLRFLNTNAATGEIEFTFDAVTPVRLRGTIDDPRIQKVLAHAMLNEQNPGVRLRAVSTMAAHPFEPPDLQVKSALIQTLRKDDNPGVRREALKALARLPFDQDIKAAFLHTLMHDANPALRIAAINCLDSARTAAYRGDQDLVKALKERSTADENSYVRLKAKEVLQEVE